MLCMLATIVLDERILTTIHVLLYLILFAYSDSSIDQDK